MGGLPRVARPLLRWPGPRAVETQAQQGVTLEVMIVDFGKSTAGGTQTCRTHALIIRRATRRTQSEYRAEGVVGRLGPLTTMAFTTSL